MPGNCGMDRQRIAVALPLGRGKCWCIEASAPAADDHRPMQQWPRLLLPGERS
jgi:hypothetical protein